MFVWPRFVARLRPCMARFIARASSRFHMMAMDPSVAAWLALAKSFLLEPGVWAKRGSHHKCSSARFEQLAPLPGPKPERVANSFGLTVTPALSKS